MIPEIYPLNIRGSAMSVALTFPVLLAAPGGADAFRMFAVLSIVAWFSFRFLVPETRGRSLKEVEANMCETTVAAAS